MKQVWEIKRLEDVVEFQRGLTYSKKDEVDFSDNIVLRSNNVDLFRNQLDFSELKYINPSIEIPENKKVKKGSLLICTANGSKSHLGKVALIDDDYNYAFGGFMGLINPKQKLNSKFLFYLMTSDNYKKFINELSDGANINNLKFGDLGQFEIPIPPLPEQQRIVSILDECFAAIDKAKANAEQNLKNAKELFESYLQGVFEKKGDGWEEKTLKEVCAKITDGTHQTPKYFDDGIIFLSSKNVTSGKIDWENIKYIDEKQHIEMHKRVAPRIGDILLAKNGTTGIAAMVDRDVVFDIYVSLAHIRVLDAIIPDFMLYFINSPIAKKQFNKRLKGSGVPNLHLEEIREVIIPFPKSKEAQQTIVRKLDALRAETQKLEAVYQKKIADLEELKKSILQKAFAGELRSPEGAAYDSEAATPLAKKTPSSITSPEGA